MNERIKELAKQAGGNPNYKAFRGYFLPPPPDYIDPATVDLGKFAELIVQEMCSIMEQAEDDAYHCFEPSERPTEYIEWLRDWQERFAKHFGVE